MDPSASMNALHFYLVIAQLHLHFPPKQDDVGLSAIVAPSSTSIRSNHTCSVISGRLKQDTGVLKQQIFIEKEIEEIEKEKNRSSTAATDDSGSLKP